MANYVLGITGGIGSGKTTVTDILQELCIDIIDADIIARNVVATGSVALEKITQQFGQDILLPNRCLNRTRLREIIFNNESDKQWLDNLLHPLIREEILLKLSKATSQYVVLVAPLLFENKLDILCHSTLLIDIPVKLQIERTIKRDTVDQTQVEQIITAQMPRETKCLLANSVIINNSSINELKVKVIDFHNSLIEHIHENNNTKS